MVQDYQLFINGESRLYLRPADARFEAFEKDLIVTGGK